MSTDAPLQQTVPAPETYPIPPITIIITIILLVLLFAGFFSLYFCKCFMQNWQLRHNQNGQHIVPTNPENNTGIDPKIIQSFPTFTYSSVKDYRKEKYGLECAICLVEFGDDDVLRLLTTCYHVFHQECIDLWLENHKTCPVCRRSLEESPDKNPISFSNTLHLIDENDALPDDPSVSITIRDESESERKGRRENDRVERTTSARAGEVQVEKGMDCKLEKFSRSRTTGHSIVRGRGSDQDQQDRYTLRLPEEVHKRIIKGHNSSKSCITFGDYKSKGITYNGGFGEISGGNINRVS